MLAHKAQRCTSAESHLAVVAGLGQTRWVHVAGPQFPFLQLAAQAAALVPAVVLVPAAQVGLLLAVAATQVPPVPPRLVAAVQVAGRPRLAHWQLQACKEWWH